MTFRENPIVRVGGMDPISNACAKSDLEYALSGLTGAFLKRNQRSLPTAEIFTDLRGVFLSHFYGRDQPRESSRSLTYEPSYMNASATPEAPPTLVQ